MESKSRLTKALEAMRTIGINENTAKPVLEKLMNLYNNEWQLIEEDNFRVLANAIFEQEEENNEEEEEPERPLKRKHSALRSEQSSHNGDAVFGDKLISSQVLSPKENDSLTPQALKIGSETNGNISHENPSKSTTDFTLASSSSSSSGEVKISLSCNLKGGKGKFVNQEELFNILEERKLKWFRLQHPSFSVKRMLKDICECVLEVATEAPGPRDLPLKQSPNTNASDNQVARRRLRRCSKGSMGNGSNGNSSRQNTKNENSRRFCVDGMTKGLETGEILWASEADYCPFFNYIFHNFAFENAAVRFALSHIGSEEFCDGCGEDCVSATSCCICASKSDNGFAYTNEGLLKESFLDSFLSSKKSRYYCSDCPLRRINGEMGTCKGHPKGEMFIKECCVKCGCHMKCGNRVVQRGIRCKLQVFSSSGEKNWGLRTMEKLRKGTFVCEYVGEVLTVDEWFEEKDRWESSIGLLEPVPNSPILLDEFWYLKDVIKKNEALCIDATYHGNIARFVNYRSMDANLVGIPVKIESSVNHHYYHVALFTIREVDAFEELTWDYGSAFGTVTR